MAEIYFRLACKARKMALRLTQASSLAWTIVRLFFASVHNTEKNITRHSNAPSAYDTFTPLFKQDIKKTVHRKDVQSCLKSGDYLSSQRLAVSTFDVKELNFCVRNGNRWILFAIITAMVIYSALAVYIHFNKSSLED